MFERAGFGQDTARALHQYLAGLGGFDAAGCTVEEGDSQLGFQRENTAAHRRLCQRDLLRRAHKTAFVGEGDGVLERLVFHSICTCCMTGMSLSCLPGWLHPWNIRRCSTDRSRRCYTSGRRARPPLRWTICPFKTHKRLFTMNYPEFYDEYVETLPRPDIESMQEGLILQLVPYVYARSALIRKTWDKAGIKPQDIRSLADFREKAPFIDKDAIRAFRDEHNDPFGGIKCVEAPHLRAVGFTSGTTGDPTPLPYARSVNTPQIKRDFWHIGARPGDYIIYDLFTFREGHGAASYVDCGFRSITFQHSPSELPRIFQATLEYKPKIMMTISTPMVMAMEEYAQKHNVDLKQMFTSFKGAVFGGEAPAPRVRRLVKEWGLDMYEITSLGDACGAIDCRLHDGFHAWEDLAFVECLDPNGTEPMKDGE